MKFKFWLLAALTIAAATTFTSCKTDDPIDDGKGPNPTPDPSGEYVEVNKWMFNYMMEAYLWNREVQNLEPDYNLNYIDFLKSTLEGVAKQGDANHDDGHWSLGAREMYYSYIIQNATKASNATRFGELKLTGFGFDVVETALIGGQYYFGVHSVVAESPAYKAGINRGVYISRIDGVKITAANYVELRKKLNPIGPMSIQLTCHTITSNSNGEAEIKDMGIITVSSATYENTPILTLGAFGSVTNPDVFCGYIAYKEFNSIFDVSLVAAFDQIKDAANNEGKKITDLIIDLRVNPGGDLTSSVVMGTLVAGNAYKGQVYCATTYNEDRKKPKDLFKIGESQTIEGENPYIGKALESSPNLKRIYVLTTTTTASASELVINGLRGLGIEVRVIGTTTNGKNVGMEPINKVFGNYAYTFAPITFRLENGKGESDYGNGFQPDVTTISPLIGSYLTSADEAFSYAYLWMTEGKKPVASGTRAATNVTRIGEPVSLTPKMAGTYLKTKTVE